MPLRSVKTPLEKTLTCSVTTRQSFRPSAAPTFSHEQQARRSSQREGHLEAAAAAAAAVRPRAAIPRENVRLPP